MARLRDIEGIKGNGRPDVFRVDWHAITPDPDNDLRDLTTPANRAHIERTKNSIEIEGVKDPLTIRRGDNDEVFAVDGRVRLVSLAELEAEGRSVPEYVLAIAEKERTTRQQRIINMIIQSTQRKNYDQFEIARGVQRLHEFSGLSQDQIAERIGWKSVGTVKNHLDAANLEPEVQDMVNKDIVSKTVAIAVTRDKGAEAPAVLKEAKAQVDASGTKNKKITPKVIARVTGKRPAQSREMTTLALDYTAIANEIEDAAKLAGGVGNLGPEKTRALLTKALTTLAKSKGQKVEEPKNPPIPEHTGPRMTEADFLTHMEEMQPDPTAPVQSLAQVQDKIKEITGADGTKPEGFVGDEMHGQRIVQLGAPLPGEAPIVVGIDLASGPDRYAETAMITWPRPINRVEKLLLGFMNADAQALALQYATLRREFEETVSESGEAMQGQEELCVAADVIGTLRFPDDWENAKATTELAQVA